MKAHVALKNVRIFLIIFTVLFSLTYLLFDTPVLVKLVSVIIQVLWNFAIYKIIVTLYEKNMYIAKFFTPSIEENPPKAKRFALKTILTLFVFHLIMIIVAFVAMAFSRQLNALSISVILLFTFLLCIGTFVIYKGVQKDMKLIFFLAVGLSAFFLKKGYDQLMGLDSAIANLAVTLQANPGINMTYVGTGIYTLLGIYFAIWLFGLGTLLFYVKDYKERLA